MWHKGQMLGQVDCDMPPTPYPAHPGLSSLLTTNGAPSPQGAPSPRPSTSSRSPLALPFFTSHEIVPVEGRKHNRHTPGASQQLLAHTHPSPPFPSSRNLAPQQAAEWCTSPHAYLGLASSSLPISIMRFSRASASSSCLTARGRSIVGHEEHASGRACNWRSRAREHHLLVAASGKSRGKGSAWHQQHTRRRAWYEERGVKPLPRPSCSPQPHAI